MQALDLSELQYQFQAKPLLIGGMAMEYYNLRKTGDDVDFVVAPADYDALVAQYPNQTKEIFGDLGIVIGKYEFWTSICLFDYEALRGGAVEKAYYYIVSLEKLLLLKALGMHEPKYHRDLELIVEKILNIQYGKDQLPDDSSATAERKPPNSDHDTNAT